MTPRKNDFNNFSWVLRSYLNSYVKCGNANPMYFPSTTPMYNNAIVRYNINCKFKLDNNNDYYNDYYNDYCPVEQNDDRNAENLLLFTAWNQNTYNLIILFYAR